MTTNTTAADVTYLSLLGLSREALEPYCMDGLIRFDPLELVATVTKRPLGFSPVKFNEVMDMAVDRARDNVRQRNDHKLRDWAQVVLGALLVSGHADLAARAAAALQRLCGDAEEAVPMADPACPSMAVPPGIDGMTNGSDVPSSGAQPPCIG